MSKIVNAVTAVIVVASMSLSMTVSATNKIPREDFLYSYITSQSPDDEEPITMCVPYIVKNTATDAGYLYVMEDSGSVPVVDDAKTLSEIVKEAEAIGRPIKNKYGVLIIDNAMSKYGDVYFSEELATDMTGVSKVINLQAYGQINCSFMPQISVYLDYKSLEEFKSNKEALIDKLSSYLPDDGYGYEFSTNAPEFYTGSYVVAYIESKAYNQGVETDVSKIFKDMCEGAHSSPEEWENAYVLADELYECDEVLGADLSAVSELIDHLPQIDGSVRTEKQIEYKVVYSAVPTNGDYNNDGLLEITDAQNLLTYSAAHVAGTTESLPIVSSAPENMDVDGDGEITIADAQYVLTYCAQQAAGMDPTWEDILK